MPLTAHFNVDAGTGELRLLLDHDPAVVPDDVGATAAECYQSALVSLATDPDATALDGSPRHARGPGVAAEDGHIAPARTVERGARAGDGAGRANARRDRRELRRHGAHLPVAGHPCPAAGPGPGRRGSHHRHPGGAVLHPEPWSRRRPPRDARGRRRLPASRPGRPRRAPRRRAVAPRSAHTRQRHRHRCAIGMPGDPAGRPLRDRPTRPPSHPASLAYALETSGTTGVPRLVGIPHGALSNYLAWSVAAYGPAPGAVRRSTRRSSST